MKAAGRGDGGIEHLGADELEAEIRRHNHLYWDRHEPEISDYDYDRLVRRLQELRPDSSVLAALGPSGGEPGREVRHRQPMLSLDKCYSDEELDKWTTSFTGDVVALPKFDGVACSLWFGPGGDLTLAATRGDGFSGDDITANVREIRDVPARVAAGGAIEVRGEIFMRLSVFQRFKAEGMANPRNLAAGAIKQKDPKKSAAYALSFVPFELSGGDEATVAGQLARLTALGFPAIDALLLPRERAREGYEEFARRRPDLDYEIDGVVFKVNLVAEQRRLGQTAHHPRFALAYKFQGDSGVSVLRAIEWSVARTGAITPVAIVDPVVLSGVTVGRASLHHAGYIDKLGLTLGAEVLLTRRGGVIPNIEALRAPGSEPILLPEVCPSCGAPVRRDKDFLYCSRPDECRAARIGRLAHYAATIDLKGFGDSILEQAYDRGFLRAPADFYTLEVAALAALDKSGEKLATKLIAEVERKRTLDLATFLRALGIAELGKHVSRILALRYGSLDRVLAVTEPELGAIHSIGETIARAVVSGLGEARPIIAALTRHVTVRETPVVDPGAAEEPAAGAAAATPATLPFHGQSFVFTGKLAALDRKAAAARVTALGGSAVDAVSRGLSYLVEGDGKAGLPSAKKKAAEKLVAAGAPIRIVAEGEFLRLLDAAEARVRTS